METIKKRPLCGIGGNAPISQWVTFNLYVAACDTSTGQLKQLFFKVFAWVINNSKLPILLENAWLAPYGSTINYIKNELKFVYFPNISIPFKTIRFNKPFF